MKAIKTLLAVSVLTVAGTASAAVMQLTATLDSQVPPLGTQTISGNNNFTGSIDVDLGTGLLSSLTLTTVGSYTSTSSFGPAVTFYTGSTWSANLGGGIPFTTLGEDNGNLVVTYEWGTATNNSNGAGSFSGTAPTCAGSAPLCSFALAGNPGWDSAVLTVTVDGNLEVVSALLTTSEVGSQGVATTNYSLSPVPLPAAAWLFGSGLIGLAGVVRRRRAAA